MLFRSVAGCAFGSCIATDQDRKGHVVSQFKIDGIGVVSDFESAFCNLYVVLSQQPPGVIRETVKQENERVVALMHGEIGIALWIGELDSEGINGGNDAVEKQGI